MLHWLNALTSSGLGLSTKTTSQFVLQGWRDLLSILTKHRIGGSTERLSSMPNHVREVQPLQMLPRNTAPGYGTYKSSTYGYMLPDGLIWLPAFEG